MAASVTSAEDKKLDPVRPRDTHSGVQSTLKGLANRLEDAGDEARMNVDIRWSYFGVTADFLEQKASWLIEERELHQRSLHFFRLAGKLVSLSRDDYELASLAFFQATIGLEKSLRLHFASEDGPFAYLFQEAITKKLVTDVVFSEVRPFEDGLLRLLKNSEVVTTTHCEALAVLIPELRNQFMHGTYLLSPEYLYLTFHLREIADVLKTKERANAFN